MIKTQAVLAVSQDTLETITTLRGTIALMQAELKMLEDETIRQLNNGVGVAEGRFAVILGTWQRRNVSWKRVVEQLKGLRYAERILNQTPFETYYQLNIVNTLPAR